MVETKVQTSWLQCTLPKADWDAINERRQKLSLKWSDIIIPGTLTQLDKLEGNVEQAVAAPKAKKGANKKESVEKKTTEPSKKENPIKGEENK